MLHYKYLRDEPELVFITNAEHTPITATHRHITITWVFVPPQVMSIPTCFATINVYLIYSNVYTTSEKCNFEILVIPPVM